MTDVPTCKCIVCRKDMLNIAENGTLQPSGGTAFQTQGHYGSHVFDPMDGSLLEIAVCDDCLGAASRRGDVVLVDDEGPRPNPAPKGAPLIMTEPDMVSAGAEIMNLAHEMEKVPDLAGKVERVRMIGAWISMGRMGDAERALIKVIGSVINAMRTRGFVFHDDQPIDTQVIAFVDAFGTQPSGKDALKPAYETLRDVLNEAWRGNGRVDVRVEGGRDGRWELVLGGHEKDGTLMVGADLHVRPDSTLAGTGETLTWNTGTNVSDDRRETFRFGDTTLSLSWSAKRRR